MIAVPTHLEESFLQVAEIEHKPVNKLIEMALLNSWKTITMHDLRRQQLKGFDAANPSLYYLTMRKGC